MGSSGLGADGPDGQSLSEYDVARDLWLNRHRPREALKHGLEAVDIDDSNHEASHLVALIYLDFCARSSVDCHLDRAEKFVRIAIDAKPDFREAKNTLGVILVHRKKYDEAITVLKSLAGDILYQTPENAWGNLGWAYLESGRVPQAIDALSRSVAAQPEFCVGNYRLGLAYERKKDFRAAREALTRALETEVPLCRGLQDAYAARARISFRLGDRDAGRRDLDVCLKLGRSSSAGKECRSMLQKLG